MAQLTGVQVARAAQLGGWPGHLIPNVVSVSRCESSWKTDAQGGTDDCCTGLMQVHEVHGFTRAQLSDPVFNMKVAYDIYKAQGPAAWPQCWQGGGHLAGDGVLVGGQAYAELLTGVGVDDGVFDILTGQAGDLADEITGAVTGAVTDPFAAAVAAAGLDNLPRKLLVLGVGMVLLTGGVALVGLGLWRLTGTESPTTTITSTVGDLAGAP